MTSAADHLRQGGLREDERTHDNQEYHAATKGASRYVLLHLSNAQTAPPHLTRLSAISTRAGSEPSARPSPGTRVLDFFVLRFGVF